MEDWEIEEILVDWTRGNKSEFCPKCVKALMNLKKTKKDMRILEEWVIASTMWEDAVLQGEGQNRQWLEYEICRMLHGWTLDDEIRFEREKEEYE